MSTVSNFELLAKAASTMSDVHSQHPLCHKCNTNYDIRSLPCSYPRALNINIYRAIKCVHQLFLWNTQ